MTSHEAYELTKLLKRSIRDYKLIVALDIAMKALAWKCAHEKMINLTTEENNADKHI